jgi:hypothetical protein
VSVKFAGIEFDNVFHDAEADVLYLDVGERRTAVDVDESTEGHHLRCTRVANS